LQQRFILYICIKVAFLMDTDFFIDILKMNSLGVTATRIALIQFLFEMNQPFIEINLVLKMAPGDISRTTLYRTLLAFCSAGLLYKIADNSNKVFYGIGDKLAAYLKLTEATNKDNYHFQCRKCGKIFCLPVRAQAIELPAGFIKTSSNLLLSGECNVCSSKKNKGSLR
jgi:Fe2+ or Zn2+ uptake regulation protein